MREYVAIVRKIFAREEPLSFAGGHYQLPYAGADATGLGKPLKTILAADPSLPVYTAAITPGGVRLAAEVADGFFPVWMNPERFDLFADAIEQGFAKAGGTKTLADFDVAPFVQVVLGDDLEQCRNVLKPGLALYIGGMGAPGKNFYTDYTGRLGYEAEAKRIQELYLGGQQQEAIAMVPDALVDDIYLVGPAARIRERLQVWKTAGGRHQVGSMLLGTAQPEALEVIAAEVL